MHRLLAGLLILLLVAVAGAEPLPDSHRSAPGFTELERTLALLDRIDPQELPADQQRALFLALTDALLADGQQERALDFLAKAAQNPASPPSAEADAQLVQRLQQVATPVLAAALQVGTTMAPLIRKELLRRGEPLPTPLQTEQVIGVLLPLSGRLAPFGQAVRQGLELAFTTLSPARPVRFVYRDTAVPDAAVADQVRELASRPDVLAIIGPLASGDAAAAAAGAGQERIPLLLLAPREGATGGYVFRNALTIAAQVQALADFVRGERLQRLAILHPATRNGEDFADRFQASIESQGGEIVARQSYPAGAVDLREQLQSLAAQARRRSGGLPDALFLPDEARQVAQIVPQLGFSRLEQLQLLGTGAWNDPELARMAGPLSEGAVFVDGFFADSPWPAVSDFVARFQATHGMAPNILHAQGYDAGLILLTLLARSDLPDRETFRLALGALRDFPGATGRTGFGVDGEAQKNLFLLQVQDGAVVQIN